MTARFIVADVFDGLAALEDGSVDLVVTSPPFLALRSYLPVDHPDKLKEIGSEATPAEFLDVMLRVTAELRRVLAPYGSICLELGDTYAGSGGAGGDYLPGGLRHEQAKFDGAAKHARAGFGGGFKGGGPGWPLAKSRTLIPQLYEIALAYGINPLTGTESPAGRWRIRNVVTWARPNPPVGALGDKWRPATSDVVVACVSDKRYWDDLATRKPYTEPIKAMRVGEASASKGVSGGDSGNPNKERVNQSMMGGAPLLDYWEIPPGGYKGAHYAVFPPALVEPLVKAMCPPKVCRECGEPVRRIVDVSYEAHGDGERQNAEAWAQGDQGQYGGARSMPLGRATKVTNTLGFTDCGHDDWRTGLVLDPFAGSGTTLAVATGHGHDAIGIDLDERNEMLARERIGPLMFDSVEVT